MQAAHASFSAPPRAGATPADPLANRLTGLDWPGIAEQLDAQGHAVLPGWFDDAQTRALIGLQAAGVAQERLQLDRLGLGCGSLTYVPRAASASLDALRARLFPLLVPIANRWNTIMALPTRYPAALNLHPQGSRPHGEAAGRAPSALTQLNAGDYMVLHQHASCTPAFPLQLVALLSEPGQDFSGGEFVMTEQRPRMQSRPIVVPMRRGDAAIIAVAQRPFKGSKGYYRVNLKHAVSRVRGGSRYGLDLLFHDALPEQGQ